MTRNQAALACVEAAHVDDLLHLSFHVSRTSICRRKQEQVHDRFVAVPISRSPTSALALLDSTEADLRDIVPARQGRQDAKCITFQVCFNKFKLFEEGSYSAKGWENCAAHPWSGPG